MVEIEDKKAGPGDLLARARKKLGLSKSDIAKQLNLSVSVINQLESDEYTDDIPDAFLRGYLRTYARVIEVDEQHIVSLYSELTGTTLVKNYYVPSTDVPPVKIQVGSHQLWFKLLSVAVLVFFLVLGWIAFTEEDENNNQRFITIPPSTSDGESSSIDLNMEELETKNADPVDNLKLTDNALADFEQNQFDTKSELSSSEYADEPLVSDVELEFSFSDDCWVRVTDSNDEVLAVGVKTAGRRFSVHGIPPIKVVLGKPNVVSLLYNQQPVDLTIYPATQTARFTLGDIKPVSNPLAE